MEQRQFFESIGVYSDLALEAHELLRGQMGVEVPGVRQDKEQYPEADVTTVTIMSPEGVAIMGKAPGTYITIEAPRIRENNLPVLTEIASVLAKKLAELLDHHRIGPNDSVLLVGLGNWEATPDSLGPKVINRLMVTRHIFRYAPQELSGGMRPVAAISPGVLGITGIETAEIIRGVVEKVRPNLLIAIDSLAAQKVDRISSTIQIADTGINPGSGVGNQRAGINQATIGIPVIAIGVPTVVHAGIIVYEVLQTMTQQTGQQLAAQAKQAIDQTLSPFGGHLTVAPKEVDDLILRASKVIAAGINQALHQGIDSEQAWGYLH